jgi:excisionase family DNA binding protein
MGKRYTVITRAMFDDDRREIEVLTSWEAADYLRMHIKTVRRLVSDGKIPGNKLGGTWRFLKSDLIAWFRENGTTTKNQEHQA